MRACFENVVLKIILMEEDETAVGADIREILEPAPVPGVVSGQIVFAQAIPGRFPPAAFERLFVKRGPNVTVRPSNPFVVVTATVVPKAVVMIERRFAFREHGIRDFIEIVGKTWTDPAWNEAGQARFGLRNLRWPNVPSPPGDLLNCADQQLAIGAEPSVGEDQR